MYTINLISIPFVVFFAWVKGHRLLDLITQLQRRQISVWRTDQSGGLALAAPNKIRVTGKEWWQIRWG